MSECKRLRDEHDVGPTCSCHTGVCVLEVNSDRTATDFDNPRGRGMCVCGVETVNVGDRTYPALNPACPVHAPTAQEHADAALRELDAICRDSLEIALPVLLNARDTAGEETPADHFIALSDEIDALLALLAEAQQERDEAQSAAIRGARLLRDFGARLREAERKIESETARAEARLKRARVAERLAEQRGEALRNLIDWADGKVGDDFGTTEWESARAALADGGQQEKTA